MPLFSKMAGAGAGGMPAGGVPGGMGGGMPGNMPGNMPTGGAGAKEDDGPHIEEVD